MESPAAAESPDAPRRPEEPAPAGLPAGRAAAFVLALYALGALSASLNLLLRVPPEHGEAAVTAGRLEELRGLLDPREVLGYLDAGGEGDRDDALWFRTQYALAPVLVERGADRARVLCRFPTPPPASRLRELGLVLERDFGDGLLLCRRSGR